MQSGIIIIIFLSLIATLKIVSFIGEHYGLHPEWQRKIIHISLGILSLVFPFIFTSVVEVAILFSLCLITLILIKSSPKIKNTLGKSLFSVKRSSLGEIFFMLSIILLFWSTRNNLILYLIPILILTIADTIAALIGIKYGKNTFEVIDTYKSKEGCIGYFSAAFIITISLLFFLTDTSILKILLIASLVGILSTLIEGVSWYGIDNFFIPISFYLMLKAFMILENIELFTMLLVLLSLSIAVLIMSKRVHLNTHALLSTIIILFFFWVTGGFEWFLALFSLLLIHIFLTNIQKDYNRYNIYAVLSIASSGLFWITALKIFNYIPSYFLFVFSLAIHVQLILLIRLERHLNKSPNKLIKFLASIISIAIFQFIFFLFYPQPEKTSFYSVTLVLIIFMVNLLFKSDKDWYSKERWFKQGLYAIIGSLVGIIPLQLYEVFYG